MKGNQIMPYIKDMKKIYSDGRHNAFTDMEYWKGYYYVTFQNAGGHAVPGDYGDILVIRSQNLKEWDVCVRLSLGDDHDDRDPALLDMGDELGVFFGSSFSKVPGKFSINVGRRTGLSGGSRRTPPSPPTAPRGRLPSPCTSPTCGCGKSKGSRVSTTGQWRTPKGSSGWFAPLMVGIGKLYPGYLQIGLNQPRQVYGSQRME